MPSGSYKQADVRCPYYQTDNGRNRICCEGVLPGSQTQSYFRKPRDYEKQIDVYCSGCYWKCEICMALDQKYEE